MKNKAILISVFLIALLAGGYYWFSSTPRSASNKTFDSSLLMTLPTTTHGFLAINFESPGFERYITNPGYQRYVAEYNKLFGSLLMTGMDSYFGFLEILGLWPKVGEPFKPSLNNLVWFFSDDSSGLQVGMFGELITTKRNGALINEISNFLKSKNFNVSDVTFTSSKGISFDIFAETDAQVTTGDQSDPIQVIDIYRQLLGKRTFFVTENRNQILFTSSKEILEDLLKDPATRAKAKILDSADFTKTKQQLLTTAQDLGFGFFDTKSFLSSLKKTVLPEDIMEDLKSFPLNYVAIAYGGDQSIIGKVLIGFEAQNDNQRKFFKALDNLKPYTPFLNLPDSSAIAFSVSGSFLKAIKNILDTEDLSEVPLLLKEKIKLLSSIDEITLAAQAASTEGSWPEGLISIQSSVTSEIAKASKELVAIAFANTAGNVPWKTIEFDGVKSEYILTPFNIGIYFAESGDNFHFATTPDAMKALIKTNKGGKNASDLLYPESKEILSNSGAIWALINYEKFSDLTVGFQRSMAAFIPKGQADTMKLMESMKYMGIIGFGLNYSNGSLEIILFQELPKLVK